jgi:uncharacterized repeat protein (TIGR03803 family)
MSEASRAGIPAAFTMGSSTARILSNSALKKFSEIWTSSFAPWIRPPRKRVSNFYGVTGAGGEGFRGSIFQVTPTGTVNTLYNFGVGLDGAAAPCSPSAFRLS